MPNDVKNTLNTNISFDEDIVGYSASIFWMPVKVERFYRNRMSFLVNFVHRTGLSPIKYTNGGKVHDKIQYVSESCS